MTKEEIILANKEFLFPAVFHFYQEPLVIARAKDQYVWDADGHQYLDFLGGIVTVSVGHCNPEIDAKVHRQIDTLQHVSTLFANEPQAALARKIASLTPGGQLTKSFFTNSGTEANETAILTARCYTGSDQIVALRHSYHGRSAMAMTLTGQGPWRLGPPQAGVVHAHNAYCYRCPFGLTYPDCEVRCALDVEELIRTTTGGRIAAFIAEPIQGVGGSVCPPPEYFGIVYDIVRKYGGLCIADEVQTGFGRTGAHYWGFQNWGVVPDMVTMAKGIGNGAPLGAVTTRTEVAQHLGQRLHFNTFGGNPVSMAQGLAVLEIIDEEHIQQNAKEVGGYLKAKLLELQKKHALIGEVRGIGLMLGVELVKDRKSKEPATAETADVAEKAKDRGLLIGKGGLYGNVIRIKPPMCITKADCDFLVDCLDECLTEAAK